MGQTMCLGAAPPYETFSILDRAPIEIVFKIFGYLDAADLCTCALVHRYWAPIVNSDRLWSRLCIQRVPALNPNASSSLRLTWKQVYRIMSEFLYWFKMNGQRGVDMFLDLNLINHDPTAVGYFLTSTRGLDPYQIGTYITSPTNIEVMRAFVAHHRCRSMFLAEALRNFLSSFIFPVNRPAQIRLQVLEEFALHYHRTNPTVHLNAEVVCLLVMSLVLLATDFTSPHIKNKMTKREFIKNTRSIEGVETLQDYLGELYDYVFLQGLFRDSTPASRIYKCNAVRNQVAQTRDHRWELYPRVTPMNAA